MTSAPDHVRIVRSLVIDLLSDQEIARLTDLTGRLNAPYSPLC